MDIIDFAFIVTIAFVGVIATVLLCGHRIALRNLAALTAILAFVVFAYAQDTDWVSGDRYTDFDRFWPAFIGTMLAVGVTVFVMWTGRFLGTASSSVAQPAFRTDVTRPSQIDDERLDIRA